MADYREKLLILLAEKYRSSKKDTGTNVIARRTKITPSQLYKGYYQNDGNMNQIEAVNQAVYDCEEKGFVTFTVKGFSSEIRDIYLIDEKIEAVEDYLEKKYQYEKKSSKRQCVENIIALYENRSPAAEKECEKLRKALLANKIPSKYQQTEELLKALVFIENNKQTLFLREASMLIYGDSKALEEKVLLHQVCKTLRDHLNRPCEENELEDEILENYHIFREKQKLCLKGNVTIRLSGKEIDFNAFRDGLEFFTDDLQNLEWIHVHTPKVMTVENRTPWLRMSKEDTCLFYLGGYATRYQRDFLQKIVTDNPDLKFLHFGDIDAGGLYIHEHLCRVTGIPFEMYRMSKAELEDERYRECLHPLTEADRVRLKALEKREEYRDLADYLLTENVKLEQEIISLYE